MGPGEPLGDEDADRGGELARVRHRQVDLAAPEALPRRPRPAREAYARLRPADDLDLLPGEPHADPERLPHRLFPRETARVALRGLRARVAVRDLGLREAALAEARVTLERALDP